MISEAYFKILQQKMCVQRENANRTKCSKQLNIEGVRS